MKKIRIRCLVLKGKKAAKIVEMIIDPRKLQEWRLDRIVLS